MKILRPTPPTMSLVNVFVTSPDTHSERRFVRTITINELKGRLESIVGIPSQNQKIVMDGVWLTNPAATLVEAGVRELSEVIVSDLTDVNNERAGEFTDVSRVEKYDMTDEEYLNRGDTVLAYKKANEIGRFSKAAAEAEKEQVPSDIKVGDRCRILPATLDEIIKLGHVRFIGKVGFQYGIWIGVELDEPVGKNDGSVQCVRYFETKPKHGSFVKSDRIEIGEFEEEELLSDLEEIVFIGIVHNTTYIPFNFLSASIARLGQQPIRAAVGARQYSQKPSAPAPAEKASSIIDSLPGNSLVSKTGSVVLGSGLTAAAISSELYVVNEESLLAIGSLILFAYIAKIAREPYNSWASTQIEKMKSVLNTSRKAHTDAVQSRIDNVGELKDVVNLTKSLFALSKDTANTESKVFELTQQNAVNTEVKSVLDSWVRFESQQREKEQALLSETVINNVNKQISDEKFQKDTVAQAVADIEQLVKEKKI
ncbi:hypothetical protein E3P77_02058 [Wallemia ichthyophaga]|uniref:ATP synthase subunit 4 n=1 Tax=Wallemia ichthyophaga TaxID=245174 RepID=A0A4T0F2D6_WALIC|nr:hypothetical protein E3P91_02373 [Wallemia ichthyophaga]TIA81225.1 hypothetical protein E3P98_02178 [Wallemia ichthyophaga]TIA99815.1 hypothetical protein E3P95_01927 [Wallemia ichthyophaga]TIB00769.1 hypothetical protein E3P94_02051 [Wallemia ichthyophaga]TIB11712.1 hypothetical protein E3P90_02318 [Wallemia ichthyophaga]